MTESSILQAKQINHGQSEIWLQAEGNELTPHRTLATNEVVNVTRRHCPEDIFKEFYLRDHIAVGQAASIIRSQSRTDCHGTQVPARKAHRDGLCKKIENTLAKSSAFPGAPLSHPYGRMGLYPPALID